MTPAAEIRDEGPVPGVREFPFDAEQRLEIALTLAQSLLALLLLLTWALGARIPTDATFGSPGIAAQRRDPIRAFLLSPVHPATWAANAAILLGFPMAFLAFGFVAAMLSAGASTLFAGIGLVFIALGIEGSRLAARAERWRAGLADPRLVAAHPYRALIGGGLVNGLRAALPDLHVDVQILVTHGDTVVWLRTHHGTQQADYAGVPATHRVITWRDMVVSRYDAAGKIAEEWGVSDLGERLRVP